MINLDLFPSTNHELFQEGMISDALNAGAKIDPAKIKDEWKKANTDGKIDIIKDTAEKSGAAASKTIGVMDKNLVVRNQSIVARARNSILQFPIYVTQTLRVNEAHIIARLFERVYTTLVQTVLSNNKIISEEEANDLVFLKQFHTNIKEAADVFVNKYYEPIDDLDAMMSESIFYTQRLTENCTVTFSVIPATNRDIILESARLANDPLAGFMYLMESPQTIHDKKTETETRIENRESIHDLSEEDFQKMALDEVCNNTEDRKIYNEKNDDIRKRIETVWDTKEPQKPTKKVSQDEMKKFYTSHDKWEEDKRNAVKSAIDKKQKISKSVDTKIDEIKQAIKNGSYGNKYQFSKGRYVRIDSAGSSSSNTKTVSADKAIDAPVILKDGDIKKINGLTPYTIEATFRMRTQSGNDTDVKYIIGIKAIMHLIRVQDLSDDLKELVDGNVKSLQKVRYKTGEISFKDYFFNIKGLKADASKHINYNKRWLNTLKRLGEYNNMYGSLLKKPIQAITGGDAPIPNGTLVLSMSDLTILTNQTGIDLSVVNNAKRLARTLFLIAVVIIDSSAGTMRVLFPDSASDWEVQSLASIDAELAKTDNSKLMSELNNMINRGK